MKEKSISAMSTLATAALRPPELMIRGALKFEPLMHRYLGVSPRFVTSTQFVYGVHRDSLLSVDQFRGYLGAVHALVMEGIADRDSRYFGVDLRNPPRLRSGTEFESTFDPTTTLAAFDTPEIAIHPLPLMQAMRARVAADPAIDLRTQQTVKAVENHGARLRVVTEGHQGRATKSFDHVFNALWDGRLAVDSKHGLRPVRQWMYRFKYGIRFQLCTKSLPSVTIVLGPFGDLVAYNDGSFYLSWYPACMKNYSFELVPPEWPQEPSEVSRSRVVADSLREMAKIVPALRDLGPDGLPALMVKGAVIVAWGETDIHDPGSELHRRYKIGVTSKGRYHSVDPGKLTMAPFFAEVCADRIMGR